MTETLTNSLMPDAASWLRRLAARGITTTLVKGRLRHFPASAYKQLTDDEVIFLRHHRDAIKEAVRNGMQFEVSHETAVTEPAPAQPEPTCAYGCGTLARCAEIKETRPDVWACFHSLDPSEVAARDETATKTMLKTMGGIR